MECFKEKLVTIYECFSCIYLSTLLSFPLFKIYFEIKRTNRLMLSKIFLLQGIKFFGELDAILKCSIYLSFDASYETTLSFSFILHFMLHEIFLLLQISFKFS